jgi:hypothetical protein
LVAGALVFGGGPLDPLIDIGRLFVNSGEYPTRIGFEHVLGLGIANPINDVTGNLLNVQVGTGFHFSRQYDLTGGDERLTGNFRITDSEVKRYGMIGSSILRIVFSAAKVVKIAVGNRAPRY